MRPESIHALLLAAGLALAAPAESLHASGAGCVPPGTWVYPGSGERLEQFPAELARHDAVLLGETHDLVEHHRWQLDTLAALRQHRPGMVIGFEMFPRRVQPVLDRWVAGELSPGEFLGEVGWEEIWGFDAELYLPLFEFARRNGVPMLALNVDRETTRRIADKGLDSLPKAERQGIGDPAPASAAYRDSLFETFRAHATNGEAAGRDSKAFQHFVEAQLFWDRAMAEAIAGASKDGAGNLVVGIMGQGHVRFGHGVAHQLVALGMSDVATAIPWDPAENCRELVAGIADAVFGIVPSEQGAETP